MTEAVELLKPALAALSPDERLSVADWIYESADHQVDPEFLEELERRRRDYESGRSPGIPAEEVFRKLRERFG